MEKDLDIELYNEYLKGNNDAFEKLYKKYKDKIVYFLFNIIKDYQKAEDITQEVFIYILQNEYKKEYSFKGYIYLVAKSRAINYIKSQKIRTEIDEVIIEDKKSVVELDILDTIAKNETKKELLEAINLLDDKYKNALYLIKIEEISYKEAANILGESIPNIKTLVHRGKNELRKILLKKGWDDMRKVSKTIIILICFMIFATSVVYAVIKIYNKPNGNAKLTPTFTSKISTMDSNKVWCGTFNLVWNDFMDDVIGHKIEFIDGYSELAEELNKQTFTVNQISENSLFKIHGIENLELKKKIEDGINEKFNEKSSIIDKCDWERPEGEQGYVLYAMLKKEFNFLEKFSILKDGKFNDSENNVKYFGLEPSCFENVISKNIEVLFYNSNTDFAVKLKTKEGEEIYLYKTTGENKSFEENYKEMLNKESNYKEGKAWSRADLLRVPFINICDEINYDELCGRYIKGTNLHIVQALQTIDFKLDNCGGSVKSEALIEVNKSEALMDIAKGRDFVYDSDFIIFLKEETKEKPYFALKVDDIEVLVEGNSNTQNDFIENRTETTKVIESVPVNKLTEKNNLAENANVTLQKKDEVNTPVSSKNENVSIIKEDIAPDVIAPVSVKEEETDEIVKFVGKIKNVTSECISITPIENEKVIGNTILIRNNGNYNFEIDNSVRVSFKGGITKSYPQNIDLIKIEKID